LPIRRQRDRTEFRSKVESSNLHSDVLKAGADSVRTSSVSVDEVVSKVAEVHTLEAGEQKLTSSLEVLLTSGTELTSDTEVDCDRVSRTEEEVTGVVVSVDDASEKEFSVELDTLDHVGVVEFTKESRSEVVVVILGVVESIGINCVHNHNHVVTVLEDVVDLRSETSVSCLLLHQALLKNILVATVGKNLDGFTVDDEEFRKATEGDRLSGFESLDIVGHGWFEVKELKDLSLTLLM
jgi:hypothetical protein